MKRSEFCYADMLYRRIYYFTEDGLKEEKVRKGKGRTNGSKDDQFARAVARLGRDGWELVNGVSDIRVTLFFTRKIQDGE